MNRDWTMQIINDLRSHAQISGAGARLLDLFNAIADGVCDDEARCQSCTIVCYIREARRNGGGVHMTHAQ